MRAAAILITATLLAACSKAEPMSDEARVEAETTAARAEIEANSVKLHRWLSAGEVDSAAMLLTEDYRWHAPNAPAGSGRENWKTMVKGMLSAGKLTDSSQTDLIVASGPLAIATGRYVQLFVPNATAKGAKVSADTGKYLWHWRKVNGTWLLATASWNSDIAAKP
jgi:ketosteroid isomerase-like protein